MNEDFTLARRASEREEGEPQQPREVGPEGARLGVSCVCAVQGLQGKSNSYYNRKGGQGGVRPRCHVKQTVGKKELLLCRQVSHKIPKILSV